MKSIKEVLDMLEPGDLLVKISEYQVYEKLAQVLSAEEWQQLGDENLEFWQKVGIEEINDR